MASAFAHHEAIGGAALGVVALVLAAFAWRYARLLLPARDNKVTRALRGEARDRDRAGWVYIVTTQTRSLEMLRDQAEHGNGFISKLTTGVKIKLYFLDRSHVVLHTTIERADRLLADLEQHQPNVALGYAGDAERAYKAMCAP